VNECVERARMVSGLSREALCAHIEATLPIRGDLEEVRAAVSNLIDNAVKYSVGDVKVDVTAAPVGAELAELRVKDQGPGIPKPELKRIFRRFYRVHGPIATRVKGTGLGLYIVRAVAKRHGGRAWAESSGPGKGSTFVLQFPLAK
jgi:two-component system sensor histidine kinase SenX3